MSEISSISSIVINSDLSVVQQFSPNNIPQDTIGFQTVLQNGLDKIEGKIANANEVVRQFTIDDSVPIHQVTIALEEARIAVELAMQVRSRLLEGYRELMNMQI